MKRVLYDSSAFDMQTHGGVSRCFAELYTRLPENISARIGVIETNNVYLQQLGFNTSGYLYGQFAGKGNFLGKKALYKLYYSFYYHHYTRWDRWPHHNREYSIRLLKEQKFDVFHPTFFDDYFLDYLGGKPFVLTVHDMIPELFPQYYDRNDPQIVRKKILMPKAAHIIAVSEKTKEDIVRLTDIPEERISVVYHGASMRPYVASPDSLFDFPYILYVGDRNLYKNFRLFCADARAVLLRHKDVQVVCTGKPFTEQEKAFLAALGLGGRSVHKFVETNQMMFDLYHGALAFVYPSEYEGFGIPILEAYKADCPVMLNRASCFPEIAGEAALYFSAGKVGSMSFAEQFEQLYAWSDSEREAFLQRQRMRLKLFSWQESAKKLATIYEKVAEKQQK